MPQALFFGAFLVAGFPIALTMASTDPEPDMAGLSLLLLCFICAVASLLAYIASSHKYVRAPSALNGLCAGVIAATSFFLVLSFVSRDFGLWPCLFLALGLSSTVAAASPLMSQRKDA